MTARGPATDRFRYDGFEIDRSAGQLDCHYSVGGRHFTERFVLGPEGDWRAPAVDAAAALLYLLAGVSYYKTTAPLVVDTGELALTEGERRALATFLVDGLGEFAHRNRLDLSGLEVTGPVLDRRHPAGFDPVGDRPLVPFGGGIDSIVTAESVRRRHPDSSLFVVNRPGDRFEAIERPAAVSGLPVVRAERQLDPQVLRSAELGLLNGHVPVTAVISAVALLAAVVGRHRAVVMSNERSASAATLVVGGRAVNHQWSKGASFEAGLRRAVAGSIGPGLEYFSLLRPYSELWVARRFADLEQYLPVFRSCNRAFTQDPARRLDHWCGRCDKCCFVDLVLAPFVPAERLRSVFGGAEPLDDPSLADRFRALLGVGGAAKPFECVGDVDECRTALVLARRRPDRRPNGLVDRLAAELAGATASEPTEIGVDALLAPAGVHWIPDGDAPEDQLV
jgi:hypothetical protein